MCRILIGALIAAVGCSRQGADDASKPVNSQDEKPMAGKTIRVVAHRKPFKYDRFDRISILGAALNEVQSRIPFAEKEVDEELVPCEQAKHGLDTDLAPDLIHRFKRPDGCFVDFLIKDSRISTLVESTKRSMKGRPSQVAPLRRRPHRGFSEFIVSPAAAAGEFFRSATEGFRVALNLSIDPRLKTPNHPLQQTAGASRLSQIRRSLGPRGC